MTLSIRDQLLALGVAKPKPEAPKNASADGKSRAAGKPNRHHKPGERTGKPAGGTHPNAGKAAQKSRPPGATKPATADKPAKPKDDLAWAYSERERQEKQAAADALAAKQREQAERTKRNKELLALLEGKSLNNAEAELPRYFNYGGKVRRILLLPEQLEALQRGELGVVQAKGSYHLVDLELFHACKTVAPENIALLVDPNQPDEQPEVPADVRW
jgi:uncharacterized protein